LFPCENWVSCERNTSEPKAFWSGRIIHSLKNNLSQHIEEIHISYGSKQCVIGKSILHMVSLWELSHLLKGILPTFQGSQVQAKSPFCQITPLLNGRSTESLVRKLSMLEARGSSTIFPRENWVSFWKEYCLPLRNLKYE
jgi:hypothetical protein